MHLSFMAEKNSPAWRKVYQIWQMAIKTTKIWEKAEQPLQAEEK